MPKFNQELIDSSKPTLASGGFAYPSGLKWEVSFSEVDKKLMNLMIGGIMDKEETDEEEAQ